MSLEVKVLADLATEIIRLQTALTTISAELLTLTSSMNALKPPLDQLASNASAVSGAPVVTSVLLTSVVILPANSARKGFIIFNNSANSAYLTFGAVSVASNCTRLIATYTSWEVYTGAIYKGPISAIRNAGTGNISVFELV